MSFVTACWTTCGTAGNLRIFLCTFGPLALLLCLSGTYRVYWLRAGINDYCRLKMLLLLGSVLACSLLFLLEYRNMAQLYSIGLRQIIGGSIVFSALSVLLIVGERLLIHYAEWFWFRKLDLQHQAPDRLRLLIYGGGLNCRVFISTLYCAQKSGDREQIVGSIDDDPVLAGLHVYGFPVFGGSRRRNAAADALFLRRQPGQDARPGAGGRSVEPEYGRRHLRHAARIRLCGTPVQTRPLHAGRDAEGECGARRLLVPAAGRPAVCGGPLF